MANEIWLKKREREARDRILDLIEDKFKGHDLVNFIKYLDTYRKTAFDAGVFEGEENEKQRIARNTKTIP